MRAVRNLLMALRDNKVLSVQRQLVQDFDASKLPNAQTVAAAKAVVEETARGSPIIVMPSGDKPPLTSDDALHTAQLMARFGALRAPFESCAIVLPPNSSHSSTAGQTDIYFFRQQPSTIDTSKWTTKEWCGLQVVIDAIDVYAIDSLTKINRLPIRYEVYGFASDPKINNGAWCWSCGDPYGPTEGTYILAPSAPATDDELHLPLYNFVRYRLDTTRGTHQWPKHVIERSQRIAGTSMAAAGNTFVQCTALLATRGVELTPMLIDARLAKASQRRHGVPLFSYHQITVPKGALTVSAVESNGTHASPRLHMRRGHVRTLSPTHTTWVRPCLVGYEERGVVVTDYVVKPYRKSE